MSTNGNGTGLRPALIVGSPGYESVVRSIVHDHSEGWEQELDMQLSALSIARVVTIDWEQVTALPEMEDDFGLDYAENLKLPFPVMFLDLSGPWGPIRVSDRKGGKEEDLPTRLLGIVIWDGISVEGSVGFTPWFEFGDQARSHEERVLPLYRLWVRDRQWRCIPLNPVVRAAMKSGQEAGDEWATLSHIAVDMGLKVLSFLESANVDLVTKPMSRQVRRDAERRGADIALTVKVREPRRSISRNGTANYSHRFEVRGHYMHFPEGTRLADADPEKLCYVPGRGMVRKIWCPPHVKGPEDKPLVPKVRVIANPSDRVRHNISQSTAGPAPPYTEAAPNGRSRTTL